MAEISNPVLLDYLGAKVIEDIRAGVKLNEDLLAAVSKYPEIDYLRKMAKPRDVDTLIRVSKSPKKARRFLAFLLFQPLISVPKVRSYLEKTWKTAKGYDAKRDLLWRLLDIKDLPIGIHEDLYDFVREDLGRFFSGAKSMTHGDLLGYVKERLRNRNFPESKAWIYLCLASLSDRKDEIGRILNKYKGSKASIVARVAKDFLKKLK
jgi:hypothetical protein